MGKDKFLALAGSAVLSAGLFATDANANSTSIQNDYINNQFEIVQETIPNLQFDSIQKTTNSNSNNIEYFETVQQNIESKKAVVFVGGVNDTYHFWDKHIDSLKDKDVLVIGYEGVGGKGSSPHNVEYMDQNAKHIADGIKKLQESGINDIQIVAHSLGGVVSKKALHILEDSNSLDEKSKIKFTAVSSPLGGFALAAPGEYLPLFSQISKAAKIAMASDMSPMGNFYQSISRPIPSQIESRMIQSLDDKTAQPESMLTEYRYNKVADGFKEKITLEGNGDHEFARDPINLEKQGVSLIDAPELPKPTFKMKSFSDTLNNMQSIRKSALSNNDNDNDNKLSKPTPFNPYNMK